MALSAHDDPVMEDLNNEEVASPPPHFWNLLEDLIQEDSFYIKFTGEEQGSTGNPFIMPCRLVLQNVLKFLHIAIPDYLSESGFEDLELEITFYYEDIIRRRTVAVETTTTNNPRLIPLIVDFQSEHYSGDFVPSYRLLYEDQQSNINGDDLGLIEIYHSMDQYVQQVSRLQARRAVASLKKIKMANEETEEKLCSICLKEFDDDGDDVSATPCNHVFHHICIVKWLQTCHLTCPLCRYQMSKKCCL